MLLLILKQKEYFLNVVFHAVANNSLTSFLQIRASQTQIFYSEIAFGLFFALRKQLTHQKQKLRLASSNRKKP